MTGPGVQYVLCDSANCAEWHCASPHPFPPLTCANFPAGWHNNPPTPFYTISHNRMTVQSDLFTSQCSFPVIPWLVLCKLSNCCLFKSLKLIRFPFFGLPKLFLCSVCCKPFCFCSLPKLHSRLEGLKDDRRNHRTFDSRVTISHPRKKKELLPSANSALRQESKLLASHSFFLVCFLPSLSWSCLWTSLYLKLFVLLDVWCVGVSCGPWVLFLRSYYPFSPVTFCSF